MEDRQRERETARDTYIHHIALQLDITAYNSQLLMNFYALPSEGHLERKEKKKRKINSEMGKTARTYRRLLATYRPSTKKKKKKAAREGDKKLTRKQGSRRPGSPVEHVCPGHAGDTATQRGGGAASSPPAA